jgi:hypothetical protein
VHLLCDLRQYEEEKAAALQGSLTFPELAEWLRETIREYMRSHPDMDNDVCLMSTPPTKRVQVYKRMLAHGNHYRVRDSDTPYVTTYDCGLLCIFNHSQDDGEAGYVGELTQIWVMDYGPTSLPIILMKADWVPREWHGPRATMKRDGDGFLLANFGRRLPEWTDPFVFPSQVQQAFFVDVEEAPGWRVVCHKQARSARLEGSKLQFHFRSHGAFDHPQRREVRTVTNSNECVPVKRVEHWDDELASSS